MGPRGDGDGEGSMLIREQQRRGEEKDVLPWGERVCKREQKLSTSSNIGAVQSQKKVSRRGRERPTDALRREGLLLQ